MKKILLLTLLLFATLTFGQNLEKNRLWRTKGVYDSIGNFIEKAKIQSFLFSSNSNQFYRLRTQDKVNMETGETKVFVYRDTLNLKQVSNKTFRVSEKEVITIHSSDSLTINFNGYTLPYVKVEAKANKINVSKFKLKVLDKPVIESINNIEDYKFTFQSNDLVKINPLKSSSEWESDFKIINFNGYVFIQGIVSAPKLITKLKNNSIMFLELDYRFEVKEGTFKIVN